MKRPLTCLTIVFCLGIFFANIFKPPITAAYIFAGILLSAAVISRNKQMLFGACVIAAVFLFGCLRLGVSSQLPKYHISNLIFQSDSPYKLKGYIVSEPESSQEESCFLLRVEEVQILDSVLKTAGNIKVRAKGNFSLFYADELLLYGRIYRPYPGLREASFMMSVRNNAGLIRLGVNKGFPVKRFSLRIKKRIEAFLSNRVSTLAAAVIKAMVLGEKRGIPFNITNAMIKTGTVHILVVSGFNVGIVAFAIFLILRLLRLSRITRALITIPCLSVYCLMAGSSTPVVRATVMAIFFLAAGIFKREPDIGNSLCLSALFILANNPMELFEIGFQLSFSSVASMVYLYPKLKDALRLSSLKNNILRYVTETCLISFCAWAGTFALIWHYFGIFSPVTVLANLIIAPLAVFVTLCGFSMLALFPFARLFSFSCEIAVLLLLKANTLMLEIPFAYFSLK